MSDVEKIQSPSRNARAIAFYLPQYHPIVENDKFWGKGFTEWTNVSKATPLFSGHTQPFLPSELGFYDLRVPEVREQQAQLARSSGIEGFCYWHYWFGNGKRALHRIFDEVLETGHPDLPFCLGWANEDWTGKWHGLDDHIIFKQEYSEEDLEDHFYSLLPAFQDKRYIRVDGKPLFLVYSPNKIPVHLQFAETWKRLAMRAGLEGLFIVGTESQNACLTSNYDAWAFNGLSEAISTLAPVNLQSRQSLRRLISKIKRLTGNNKQELRSIVAPSIYSYAEYASQLNLDIPNNCFPTILSNWDNTPRCGKKGVVFINENPELFSLVLKRAIQAVSHRPLEHRIVFIKSWNEWAEGNTVEPSRKWGKSYLRALSNCLLS